MFTHTAPLTALAAGAEPLAAALLPGERPAEQGAATDAQSTGAGGLLAAPGSRPACREAAEGQLHHTGSAQLMAGTTHLRPRFGFPSHHFSHQAESPRESRAVV